MVQGGLELIQKIMGIKCKKIRWIKAFRVSCLVLGLVLTSGSVSQSARALDRDLKDVINVSLFGLTIGTGVGLLAWPLAGKLRAIPIGSSIGLYLGIVAGIYHIQNRRNPENPLTHPASHAVPPEGTFASDLYGPAHSPPWMYWEVSLVEF